MNVSIQQIQSCFRKARLKLSQLIDLFNLIDSY